MLEHNVVRRTVICWMAVLFVMGMLAGCETCKGAGRDIKAADAWMKDNLW